MSSFTRSSVSWTSAPNPSKALAASTPRLEAAMCSALPFSKSSQVTSTSTPWGQCFKMVRSKKMIELMACLESPFTYVSTYLHIWQCTCLCLVHVLVCKYVGCSEKKIVVFLWERNLHFFTWNTDPLFRDDFWSFEATSLKMLFVQLTQFLSKVTRWVCKKIERQNYPNLFFVKINKYATFTVERSIPKLRLLLQFSKNCPK
jgi:hypothetical protein